MTTVNADKEKAPMKVKLFGSVVNFLETFIYRKDLTVNRRLQAFLDITKAASSKPQDGISTEDVVIDAPNDVWVRVFKIEDGNGDSQIKLPLIIYYHGGGFVGLSAELALYDNFCRKIAKACNAVVVSVNYRRAPEHPYPAAYDDCYSVFDWLRSSQSSEHLPAGVDLSQCFLMGDSAGGNIVHFMGCRAAENDISPLKLRAMVELQPFYGGEDLTPSEINIKPPILPLTTAHWGWRAFLPGENRDHPACNVFGPNAPDISHLSLPPILVITGTLDILLDREEAYVEKLKEMGKDVTMKKYVGGYHAFYILGFSDVGDKAMADVYEYINSHKIQ